MFAFPPAILLAIGFNLFNIIKHNSTNFRTPTPFKIAMEEIGKKSGLKYEPSSPGLLVEDITEMIQREENSDTTVQLNDSLLSSTAEIDMQVGILF